jgi:hypothetical protein
LIVWKNFILIFILPIQAGFWASIRKRPQGQHYIDGDRYGLSENGRTYSALRQVRLLASIVDVFLLRPADAFLLWR